MIQTINGHWHDYVSYCHIGFQSIITVISKAPPTGKG